MYQLGVTEDTQNNGYCKNELFFHKHVSEGRLSQCPGSRFLYCYSSLCDLFLYIISGLGGPNTIYGGRIPTAWKEKIKRKAISFKDIFGKLQLTF